MGILDQGPHLSLRKTPCWEKESALLSCNEIARFARVVFSVTIAISVAIVC